MSEQLQRTIEGVQEYLRYLQQQQLTPIPTTQTETTTNEVNLPTAPVPLDQLLSPSHQQQISTRLSTHTFSPYSTTPSRTPRFPPIRPTFSSPSHNDRTDVSNFNRRRLESIRNGSSSSSSNPTATASSPSSPSRPPKLPKLSISKKIPFTFFVLGKCTDEVAPDIAEEDNLNRLGYGIRTIEIEKNGSPEDFILELKSLSEKIGHSAVQFTLMYSRGNRKGSPLLTYHDQPTASSLKSHGKTLGTIRWFLRPSYNLVEPEDEGASSSGSSSSSTSSTALNSSGSSSSSTSTAGATSSSSNAIREVASQKKPKIRVVVEKGQDDKDNYEVFLPAPHTLKQLCQLQKSRDKTIIRIDTKMNSSLTAQCILDIFENQSLNPFNDITVRVEDEEGTDIGGISRDFFWKSLDTLKKETVKGFPLFFGVEDHLSFSSFPELIQDGTYKKLALFLLHFSASTGFFCPGLSQPVYQIITNQTQLTTTSFLDCANEDDRNAAMTISLLTSTNPIRRHEADISQAQTVLNNHGIMEKLDEKSATPLLKKLYISSIKNKQLPALEIIQKIISNSIIGTFLNEYNLYTEVCPNKEKLLVTPDSIIKRIQNRNSTEMRTPVILLSSYLHNISEHGHTTSEFMMYLTGSPVLDDDMTIRLHLVEEGRLITSSTCFCSLEIPQNISQEEFNDKMNLALGPDGQYFHCS